MSDFKVKLHQIQIRLELRPDPARGAYSVPPGRLAGYKGLTSKGREGNGGSVSERGRKGMNYPQNVFAGYGPVRKVFYKKTC